MFVSGMHITYGILNHQLWAQTWTYYVANTTVMLVIMSWYLAVIVGLILGRFLIKKYEKKTIGVRVCRLKLLSYFKYVFLLQFIAIAIYTVSGVLFIAAPNIPAIIALGRICSGVGHGIIYLSTLIEKI
jgi:MFS family permease